MEDFFSPNIYQRLEVLIAESPQELVDLLKSIKTPFKIVQIVASGPRREAYIYGDLKIKRVPKKGEK